MGTIFMHELKIRLRYLEGQNQMVACGYSLIYQEMIEQLFFVGVTFAHDAIYDLSYSLFFVIIFLFVFWLLQDLLLCGVYARREATYGNIDHARKVFDMALLSVEELPVVCIDFLLQCLSIFGDFFLLPLLRDNLKHMLPFGWSTICTFKEVCVAQHLICDIRLGILHVCFKHMTCLIGYL